MIDNLIHGADEKTETVDDDEFVIADSEDDFSYKKVKRGTIYEEIKKATSKF